MKITKSRLKQIIREKIEVGIPENSPWVAEADSLLNMLTEFSDRYVSLIVKSGMNDRQRDRATEEGKQLSDMVNQVEDGIRAARSALIQIWGKL